MTTEQDRPTIDYIEEQCRPDHGEQYRHAALLVASAFVGSGIDALVGYTGYEREFVEIVSSRMREAGVWIDGGVYAEWLDDEGGGMAFVLDTLVAAGMLQRVPAEPLPSEEGAQDA